MQSVDAFARHALETLPLNVAVIDEDGIILLTNQSWEEFAGIGPEGEDMVGVNYLREVSGRDLAASMDISPSTYDQHLRAAERKVLDALFDG